MKLKKMIFIVVSLLIAIVLGIGEFTYFKNKNNNSYVLGIVAGKDIVAGEKITNENINLVKIDKTSNIVIAKDFNEINNKYTKENIKKGEPIIPYKLTPENPANDNPKAMNSIIKIEPVPLNFILNSKEITLVYINVQTAERKLVDNVKVKAVYDAQGAEVDLNSIKAKNEYRSLMIACIQINADKEVLTELKQLEKMGTFTVLKK